MSDVRDLRFWGEDDSIKGGEFRDSDNNAIRLYKMDSNHAGYPSLTAALEPAAAMLDCTAAELFDALKALDPLPEPQED